MDEPGQLGGHVGDGFVGAVGLDLHAHDVEAGHATFVGEGWVCHDDDRVFFHLLLQLQLLQDRSLDPLLLQLILSFAHNKPYLFRMRRQHIIPFQRTAYLLKRDRLRAFIRLELASSLGFAAF